MRTAACPWIFLGDSFDCLLGGNNVPHGGGIDMFQKVIILATGLPVQEQSSARNSEWTITLESTPRELGIPSGNFPRASAHRGRSVPHRPG